MFLTAIHSVHFNFHNNPIFDKNEIICLHQLKNSHHDHKGQGSL